MKRKSEKVKFFRGWTSLNENLTTKLTFNVKMLLENRLANGKLHTLQQLIKLHVKTFFCIHQFDYKVSKVIENTTDYGNIGRSLDYLDVIFLSKDGHLHQIEIRGQDHCHGREDNAIFYESSDSE